MEKTIEKGDIVSLKNDTSFVSPNGEECCTIYTSDLLEVVETFTDIGYTKSCLVKANNFVTPIMIDCLELVEKGKTPEEEDDDYKRKYNILKASVENTPRITLGYLFKVNGFKPVVADTIEEAIEIYKASTKGEVNSIYMLEEGIAYVKNKVPETLK